MKNFEPRWQQLTAKARQSPPREESAPAGFAGKVVARAFNRPESQPETDPGWDRLMIRFFAGALATLAIIAALEGRHLRHSSLFDPGIENSVAQLVWTL